MKGHYLHLINRANLLGILVSGLGFCAFAFWPLVSSDVPERSLAEPTFLEEWWNVGQAKGFRSWGGQPHPSSAESHELDRLISGRANLQVWSEEEISGLSQYILTKSAEFRMSPFFVMSLIDVESGYEPAAISNRGAVGLLQLLPATAEEVAQTSGLVWAGAAALRDPKMNIDLGLRYIGTLKRQFKSNEYTLTAYNMGPAALERKLRTGETISNAYARRVMDRFSDYKSRSDLPSSKVRQWSSAWR